MIAKTQRGLRTRASLLAAAEEVFLEHGYHDASVVKITEAAGVSQGTFYLYFEGKKQLFDELVLDLNRRVRHAMSEGAAAGRDRREAERLGFAAFFRFTGEHPALYRMIRQAEFVSPEAQKMHYSKIVDGYVRALTDARDAGEIADIDPVVTAWALMGIGEIIGMRWVLWQDRPRTVPRSVLDEVTRLIDRILGVPVQRAEAAPKPRGTAKAKPRAANEAKPRGATEAKPRGATEATSRKKATTDGRAAGAARKAASS